MSITITGIRTIDIRFPTSRALDGSDAMNPDPDYSAAYVVLGTDSTEGLEGHGLTFTIGRGNELCCAAAEAVGSRLRGRSLESLTEDMGAFWDLMTGDSQYRWLGPEKGVVHLAAAAVINAVWDLYAKAEGKPLWKLLADMTPERLVACVPFRYITDALTREEALEILRRLEPTKAAREARIRESGYPAYTTSAGWLGYTDEKIRRLLREALEEGWTHFKMKVGRSLKEDVRRAALIREEIGRERVLMLDANQVWDVGQAIEWVRELSEFEPLWIEEPTSPDDVLGHAAIARAVAPVRVATGEHCHNRVMFKQLLQAGAVGFCQIDSCRLGGVNEVLAVLLLAAKFGVPVCPHAGGVGLCEYVQHLSVFDYVAVSGSLEGRRVEFVDHLHEHFINPVVVRRGHYVVPDAPGYSIEMKPETLRRYEFPDGAAWAFGAAGGQAMNKALTVALVTGPAYDPLYERLQGFTEATGVKVSVGFGGDHPSLNRHLASLAEVPYDLVSTHTKYAPSQLDFLAPLEGLVGADELEDFVPLILELASVGGSLYGVPRNIDVRLLHYRSDLISRPPATWDALLEEARRQSAPPGLYGFVFPGRESGLFGTFYELAEMAGARLFPDDLVPDIENEGGRWALGLLRALYEEGLVPRELPAWHYEEVHECFRTGRAAMVGDWPGYYALYRDGNISAVHDRLGLSPYPVGPAGKSLAYGGGHTFALTKRGAERPEALKLLLHLTAPVQQLFEARCGCVPVRRSVMRQVQSESDASNRARLAMLEEVIAGHILVPPKFARYPQVEEVLWHAVQRAVVGELSIEEALAHMTDQIGHIVRGD